jgi:hypothetical protein
MNLAYVFMPVGILFLGVPATALCSTKVRARLRQPARRRESGMTSLARTPINWVDLVRAGIGAWLIQNALSSARSGQDDLALIFLAVQIALVSIAVLVQTVRLGRPMHVTGPLFFLSGLALVLCGPLVAGFALALGLSCALMLRRLGLVFAFVPPGLLVFGYLFGQLGIMTIVIAGAFALPLFLSFALHSRITYARRPAGPRSIKEAALRIEAPGEPEAGAAVVITPDFGAARVKVGRGSIA